MALSTIFGDTLLTPFGAKPTQDALGGKKAIGIYFSAQWCPPCRAFTPELAEIYLSTLALKGMEVVFVSSDKDEASFWQHYREMPWCALPFSKQGEKAAIKEALMKEFKSASIPSLVIISADGELITRAGRAAVTKDPACERFPWYPPTKEEKAKIILDAIGPEILAQIEGKHVALYFAASWCLPCHSFTWQLAQLYEQGLKEKMEIVFVSSDRDMQSFEENYSHMPWLALPYCRRADRDAISAACCVEGLPCLVVLNSDGTIMTTDGRSTLQSETKAETFPEGWSPEPLKDVNCDPSDLHEERCVLALGGSGSPLADAVNAVALEYCEAAGNDMAAMPLRFFKAPDGEVTGLLRRLTGIESGDRLVMLDIPNGGVCYVCEKVPLDAAGVKAFIADSLAGKSDRRRLSRK